MQVKVVDLQCHQKFLAFLDENAKGMVNQKGGQWSPLLSYRSSLAQQDDKEEGQQKGSKAKRKLPMEGDESREGEWLTKEAKKPKQQKAKAPRGRPPKSTKSTAQQTEPPAAKPVKPAEQEQQQADDDDDDDDISSGSGEWTQEEQTPLSSVKKTDNKVGGRQSEVTEKQEQQKRKREETSQSDDEGGDEDDDDRDFESLPPSSQKSWLSSQKEEQRSKKARISYSKKDISGIGCTSLEDIEDEEEIEEYESEEDADMEKKKPPIRVRQEKRELPEAFFGDSQEEKDTEDDSLLEPAL